MLKRKFTVATQLHEKNNHDLIEYRSEERRVGKECRFRWARDQ